MDEILTSLEVAYLLKIHPKTVYKLAKKGVIPGARIGRGWRFERTEILELLHPLAKAREVTHEVTTKGVRKWR